MIGVEGQGLVAGKRRGGIRNVVFVGASFRLLLLAMYDYGSGNEFTKQRSEVRVPFRRPGLLVPASGCLRTRFGRRSLVFGATVGTILI